MLRNYPAKKIPGLKRVVRIPSVVLRGGKLTTSQIKKAVLEVKKEKAFGNGLQKK